MPDNFCIIEDKRNDKNWMILTGVELFSGVPYGEDFTGDKTNSSVSRYSAVNLGSVVIHIAALRRTRKRC